MSFYQGAAREKVSSEGSHRERVVTASAVEPSDSSYFGAGERSVPKFDVVLSRERNELVARIRLASGEDDVECAFYLRCGKTNVAKVPYSPSIIARFTVPEGPGKYHVRAFVRGRPGGITSNSLLIRKYSGALPLAETATWQAGFSSVPSHPTAPRIGIDNVALVRSNETRSGTAGSILYRPRADVEPHEFRLPIDWGLEHPTDRNWNAQIHMWRLGDHLLHEVGGEVDPSSVRFFVQIVLDWHRHHFIEVKRSIFSWAEGVVGHRAMRLAFVLSQWQHGKVTLDDDVLEPLNELVAAHLDYLLDARRGSYSNHTVVDLHGVMALAQVVDEAVRARIVELAAPIIRKTFDEQFSADGIHFEHSPGYHFHMLSNLRRMIQTGWFDAFGLSALYSKASVAAKWMRLPDGRVAPIGDTNAQPPRTVARPVFSGRDEVFNSTGYVVVRDDGGDNIRDASYLFFMGARKNLYHKHDDDLSVIWFKGEDILCDAGKYAYKVDDYSTYFISRGAHNTVEVADQPGAADDARRESTVRRPSMNWRPAPANAPLPYGSAVRRVERHSWGHLIDGQVRFRDGTLHSRVCLHSVDGWLIVVDRLRSAAVRDFTQWWHFAPGTERSAGRQSGHDFQLPSGRTLAVATSGDRFDSEIFRGVSQPRLRGWTSRAYGEVEPTCCMAIRQSGAHVTFATLFAIDRPGCTVAMRGVSEVVAFIDGVGHLEFDIGDVDAGL